MELTACTLIVRRAATSTLVIPSAAIASTSVSRGESACGTQPGSCRSRPSSAGRSRRFDTTPILGAAPARRPWPEGQRCTPRTPSRWASQTENRPGFPANSASRSTLLPSAGVSAAASRPARRACGIASFPPAIPQNPYQRLLYDHLSMRGLELVDRAELKLPWLWRNRGKVRALHFHWPQSYYLWLWDPAWARRPLSC